MRGGRFTAALSSCALLVCSVAGLAQAQQIYRWTDADGKVHFGNSPPPNSKDVQADGRARSQAELACEGEARRECERELKRYGLYSDVPSTTARDCLERNMERCASRARAKAPPTPNQRTLVTARVKFDPSTGDQLVCQMNCRTDCKGTLEIWDTDNLVRGENPGAKEFRVRVIPKTPGSAYCRSTTTDAGSKAVLNLVRGDAIVFSAPAR